MNKESASFVPRPFVLPRLSITTDRTGLPPLEVRAASAMTAAPVFASTPIQMLEAPMAAATLRPPQASSPAAPPPLVSSESSMTAARPLSLGLTNVQIVEPAVLSKGLHTVAVGMLVACAALLVVAGHMAGSTALYACAALFVSDLAKGTNIHALPAGSRPQVAIATLIGATTLVAWSLWGMIHQFSGTVFVLGLLVVLAILPVLLLNFVAGRLLRRSSSSVVDQAVYGSSKLRALALVITLAAGVQAFRSFSALPDALATVPIVALAAANVFVAIRQRAHNA